MNTRAQQLCIWCGPAMVVLWLVGWWLVAGFVPPPAPETTPEQTLAFFTEHNFPIRLGLVVTLFASALLVPWSAAVSAQMARIEGSRSVLAMTQFGSGALLSLEFIIPIMVWQAAAYHPSPERMFIVAVLQDMGWLMFVGVISSAVIQVGVFGVAILLDHRSTPILPRWSGYFCLWIALLLSPAGLVPLFKQGPFAWNGLFAFWIPLTVFCAYMATMAKLLLDAVKADTPEAARAEAIG